MTEQRSVDLYGCYALPAAIALTAGAFGGNVRVKIGGVAGSLLLPRLAWEGDRPVVMAPERLPHGGLDSERWAARIVSWGRVSSWNPSRRTVAIARAHAVGFRFRVGRDEIKYSEYLFGRGHPVGNPIDLIFEGIDSWFDRFRTWLEVMTEQDLDHRALVGSGWVRGSGLELLTLDDGKASLPAFANSVVVTLDRTTPASLHVVRAASQFASDSATPPEDHLLLRDARAAARRGDFRRAVIEAASALEIALAEFNDEHVRVTPPKRPMLGWYVTNSDIAAAARLPDDLKQSVVDVRNEAIHEGRAPSLAVAQRAINVVASVLRTISPLPARGRQQRTARA